MRPETQHMAEKFYRGFWGILTKWFKVPEHPPSLATRPGEDAVAFKPSEGYLRYMKFHFWIALAVVDILLIIGWLALLIVLPLVGILVTPIALALIILPDLVAYLAIYLKYDTTWYVMTERSIRIRRGIWVITEMTLTYENIQNVNVSQGPLQRYFNISDIVIETAGGGGGDSNQKGPGQLLHQGRIEGIQHAKDIRDLILSRLRKSRSAGLGDDAHEPVRLQPMWTPEHIAVLKEIRELV